MKGSRESLVRQNVIADAEGLDRIEDDSELARMVGSNDLVMLPATGGLRINDAMPVNRRYCRPWTAKFLRDLARVHSQRFGAALVVTSAVRTAEYQRHLLLINGNAAPAEGGLASPHLTGATIDIAKKGMSMAAIGWLRAYLLPLQTSGKIDVEEEFRQACFHITVYNSYLPPATIPPALTIPSRRHGGRGAILAARLR